MIQIDKNTFFSITQVFDYMPFTQSMGWWAMNSGKDESHFVFFVDNMEKPSIACLGYVMRKFGLKMLQIEGECFFSKKEIESKKIRDFYREISQTDFDIIEINSSLKYNMLYEIGIREAGYLKPVGLFSIPLTIEVDLKNKIEFDRNWKRNLEKAAKNDLEFEIITQLSEKDYSDFCTIYNIMTERKNVGNHIDNNQVINILADNSFQLFFVKQYDKRIAAIITYCRNNFSIGVFAGSTNEALSVSATFFMYNQLFQYFKNKGVKVYDMARICPGTHSKQSVFLFKNGVRGEYVQYCGEFSFYKRQIYRYLMYFVKKYLFKKVEV